ncbi:MAG: phenylalanine--tRNA ligase beta subunit-related protein [Candidatus Gracilibacteria bacterium]|jgi:DNA/RNA-binding domain of Phe-tRNA-synthetase-like protein
MPNNDIKFSVEPALADKGLKIKFATFSVPNIPRRRGSGLDQHIKEVLTSLNIDELLQSPIIAEYKRLQKEAGIQEPVAPAEHLLKLIKKSGMLPNINRVVDCYNIASAETLLSMGAHNLANIKGDIQLKTTDGTEKYTPLFKSEPEKVAPGEYAAMDEEKILCRFDLKQCDETKCGEGTTDFLVYVQGNAETSNDYVLNGLQKVCNNIKNFCDGEYLIRE